jgi:hypothetical protein
MKGETMNNDFDDFIKTIKAPNTLKVVNSLQDIGKYDYSECTLADLEKIIISMKPNSLRAITTICYVLGLYSKHLNNKQLYDLIQEINRNELWLKAKPNAPKKFISYSKFEDVYRDIGIYEDLNSFYYQTLFKCLYEGIYSDDMSVIKNLRASDIKGNIVTLKEDNGHSYELEMSKELAVDLKEMSSINVWERKNRYGIVRIKTEGLYSDSCFKVENRKGSSEYAYRYSYYRLLRKISKEYLEYNLLPLQLFISGIMYRIGLKLEYYGITIEKAFSDQNRDRLVSKIIADELLRCNCNTEVRNFREMVKGHLDVFTEN